MAAAHRTGFRFRRLDKPEEYRSAEEIQRATQAVSDEAVIPAATLRAVQDHGGLVLGAYVDIYLAGFVSSFLGWDGSTLYQYASGLAVRPEYQNHHVGFRLMAFAREESLRQGLAMVRFTFDPLQSRAAYLAIRRLGGRIDRYLVHYYGRADSGSGEVGETDRVAIRWALNDPATETRLAGKVPAAAAEFARYSASHPILQTEAGESGLRVPSAVGEPTGPTASIEIPFDIALVRTHEPAALRRWRHAVRDAFRIALDAGYVVDDFAVVPVDHERRSVYLLTEGGSEGPAPGAPGSVGAGPVR